MVLHLVCWSMAAPVAKSYFQAKNELGSVLKFKKVGGESSRCSCVM